MKTEDLNPITALFVFVVNIVWHGIVLGIMLAIAFPVKALCDRKARQIVDVFRKKETFTMDKGGI